MKAIISHEIKKFYPSFYQSLNKEVLTNFIQLAILYITNDEKVFLNYAIQLSLMFRNKKTLF